MAQAGRSAKNLIYSGGKSLARSFVGGVKKAWSNHKIKHNRTQERINKQGKAGLPWPG